MEDQHPFWKFAENPFTWGGIGVVIGAALVSPASFKVAFICGGLAIAIGLLRASSFKTKPIWFRIIGNLVLCGLLGFGWVLLRKIIPKPMEPATPDQIAEAIVKKQSNQAVDKKPETPQAVNASDIADAVLKKLPKEQTKLPPPPPAEGVQEMSNKELRDYTVGLANRMRDFEAAYESARLSRQLAARPRPVTMPQEQIQKIHSEQVRQDIAGSKAHEAEFKKRLWGSAHAARDELLLRLKQVGINAWIPPLSERNEIELLFDQGSLTGDASAPEAANYLDTLSTQLQ